MVLCSKCPALFQNSIAVKNSLTWGYFFVINVLCYFRSNAIFAFSPQWRYLAQNSLTRVFSKIVNFKVTEMHYEPKSPIWYDDLIFVNFRFSKFFLAQIHPETSNLHGLCLKSLDFVIKFIISYVKLSSSHQFFSFELNLLNKKPEVKSKKNPKWPFSEIFGKSFLLGASSRYQRVQK